MEVRTPSGPAGSPGRHTPRIAASGQVRLEAQPVWATHMPDPMPVPAAEIVGPHGSGHAQARTARP
ncbi:MAG: hypothetical protein ACRDYX_06450 [Egibacteraceae bacterium]